MKSKTAGLLPLRSLLFILAGLAAAFVTKSALAAASQWWTAIDILVNLVTLATLYAVCRAKGVTYGDFINYEKGKTDAKTMAAGITLVLFLSMSGIYGAGFIFYGEIPHFPAMMIRPVPLWLAITGLVVLPLTTTLAEDGIYIGVLHQTSQKAVLFVSMFFYAAQHCFIPLLPDARYMLYRFVSFLPAVAAMCLWYRRHKNPLPIMAGHFIVNVPTIAMIIATSAAPGLYEQWTSCKIVVFVSVLRGKTLWA